MILWLWPQVAIFFLVLGAVECLVGWVLYWVTRPLWRPVQRRTRHWRPGRVAYAASSAAWALMSGAFAVGAVALIVALAF